LALLLFSCWHSFHWLGGRTACTTSCFPSARSGSPFCLAGGAPLPPRLLLPQRASNLAMSSNLQQPTSNKSRN